ncbi:hypothetical protein GCM10008959_13390 [Deinococcus seoulensis]|uniref:site-specific DNA-methyltransferase (adenine-specific) n=1 Tax=Deinococcus seoulensis TaxID=1837379 RepID=A0ABQ2RNU3_9DEIO|nr:DNA methyltransferase [Deinococcus seoulensis]GGR53203.1 hypothetical protein GCM10008959_13390 [Deinococcus seoulensis]
MSTRTLSSTELKDIRAALRDFNFTRVMNLLGWNHATGQSTLSAGDDQFTLKPIAQLGGVQVIEVTSQGNPTTLPLEQTRRKLSDELTSTAREHVLIFVDAARTQSHWYWVKRELDGTKRKAQPRTHTYIKGQPDDLFIGKLSGLFVDIAELDDNGELPVLEAARRLSTALDSEAVVKRFYNEFKDVRETLAEQIRGISDPKDRAWYASVLLNRLMFVYFLQGKGFLGRPKPTSDGDRRYLQHKLDASRTEGPDLYYSTFLHHLFFDAFAKPEDQRSADTVRRTGQIPYLNGGLFLKHGIELKYPGITIPDAAFDGILDLFGKYTWNLSEDDKHANGLDPDVLGHIFEKYINQKGFGAYYTRPEITEYLCEQTVRKLVLDKIKAYRPSDTHLHHNLSDALTSADRDLVRHLLTADEGLKQISLLDPACGSGAFLVAALKTMLDIYTVLMGRIHALHDPTLLTWEAKLRGSHASYHYNLKKQIITDNLYGVDLMPEAAEIAKLRLFLSLVSSANTLDDLEPLPNIDFNILTGNSLIGLLEVNENAYNAQRSSGKAAAMTPLLGIGSVTYGDIVKERQRLLKIYRHRDVQATQDLTALREDIQRQKDTAYETLNALLHKQFHDLGIKYEEVTWDAAKGKEGKTKKRALTLDDITALKPFHWAFEFAEVMARGGFDAVIANPPWDVWQTDEKEFFQRHATGIQKNKIRIEDWKKKQAELMAIPEIRDAWLEFASRYPHTSAYFKKSPQFSHNISFVNGRNVGSKINLYTYFLEQSYRLLRDGGECGIVIPSGVYTDLGAKGLREMLFEKTEVTGLFAFENRRMIFENVDSRFKFVVLSFRKGHSTQDFPAAFMRHDVKDLKNFPGGVGMTLSVDNVRRLSPDSLSVMEFKSELDAHIAEKMLRFPLLGEQLDGVWNLKLSSEFNMTTDSHLFHTQPAPGRLPLYEGKMIHQFRHDFAGPRYWVDEKEGRKGVLGRDIDAGQTLDFQGYRLGFRDIARNTDSRTLISTVIPPAFHGNKLPTTEGLDGAQNLSLAAIFNSFTMDWVIRQKVTTTINFFYIYQLPVPRLTSADPSFQPIVTAAAKLICTTPEFDDLAKAAGLQGHTDGVTDDAGRAALRAELDARVAHLYGLSESEFTHILGTFPLVDQTVKDAALAEFRRLAPAGVLA